VARRTLNLQTMGEGMDAVSNYGGGKPCSICGVWHVLSEYNYGNKENRSYCRTCDKEEKVAYRLGGKDAARSFRETKRFAWK
jgi:hypothetical protein